MTTESSPRRLTLPLAAPLALLLLVLALQACSSLPQPAATSAADSSAPVAASAESELAVERQWLQSWFKDTPVLIDQRGDGLVVIDIPRQFCFDAGRTAIKPALAAVLDKVAQSLRRAPRTQLLTIAAPGDTAEAGWLSMRRANQVRVHLLGRGAPAPQLGTPTSADAAAVQLRMGLAPS